jgi:hypothetical protein
LQSQLVRSPAQSMLSVRPAKFLSLSVDWSTIQENVETLLHFPRRHK